MKIQGRHGDLAINSINKLPEGLKKLDTNVLMHGESGNTHTLICEKQNAVEIYEDNQGNKYFEAKEDCQLTHQEHKTVEIQRGFYSLVIEEEFNPWDNALKKVQD